MRTTKLVTVIVDHREGNELPSLTEEERASFRTDLIEAAAEKTFSFKGMEEVIFDGTFVRPVSESQEPNHPFCLWRVYGLSSEQAVKTVQIIIKQVTGEEPHLAYVHALRQII